MKPCARCHRHVRRAESACPFCGAALHDAPAPPTLAAWHLGATLLIACGPSPAPEAGDSSGSTSSTTTGNSTTTTATTSIPTTGAPDPSSTSCGDDCNASDEGAGFIYAAPATDGPVLGCDAFQQDCPAGEKCVPWAEGGGSSWNATHCVPISGDQTPGEPCTSADALAGLDDCRLGAICWNVDNTGHGICVAQCTGTLDAPVCPDLTTCMLANENVLSLCLPNCDPLASDCEADETCIPNDDDFVCIFDASDDEGQTNDPCEFVNSCDPGLVCLNTAAASAACMQGSQGCCQPFCEFPGAPCPNPDQKCVQWFAPEDIPPGGEDIGVCAIPM